MAIDRKRLDYIDTVKAISMLMIMFGHITELGNPVDVWMSSCKICTFYVISGFLMAYTKGAQKRTPSQFTGNLLRKLAWPYLTFSVIAIAVKCFYSYSKHRDMSLVSEVFDENLRQALFLKGINSMWFLPTLFFGELVIMLLVHAPKFLSWIYACAGLFALKGSALLTEHIASAGLSQKWTENLSYLAGMAGKSLTAAWFIGFGYLVYRIYEKKSLLKGHGGVKLLAGLVLTVCNIWVSQMNSHVDFNQLDMGGKPALFVFGGTVGALGLMLLADGLSSRVKLDSFNYWGKNSLILMCTHTALGFKTIAVAGWKKVAHLPEVVCKEYYLQCFMILIVLMLMMVGVIELINRHFPYLTVFPGRKKKR